MANSTTRLELLATSPAVSVSRAVTKAPSPAAPAEWAPDVAYSIWDAGEVLSQLERILASDAFDASARNRAFLRYVVNETLGGRADHIKGYTVAQEVFHRDADFDPQLDPVVRIEASRLRRSLERYYLTAGRRDPLHIDLPKGGYVPTFTPRDRVVTAVEPEGASPSAAPRRARDPFIVVRPFEDLSGTPTKHDIAAGLAEEIIGSLAGYDGLAVIAEGVVGKPLTAAPGGFVLQGSTRRSGTRLRVTAQLLDYADGRYLWVRTFDRTVRAKDLWALQEDIAAAIAKAVAGPAGALAVLTGRP